jgi:antitoxin component YwqK of YwqJK toxin-antitoxin module
MRMRTFQITCGLSILLVLFTACPATPRKRKEIQKASMDSAKTSVAKDLLARSQSGELELEQFYHSADNSVASEKYVRKDGSYYLLLYSESQKLEYAYFYDAQGDKLWEESYFENGLRKTYLNARGSSKIKEGQKYSIEYYENGSVKKESNYRNRYGAIEEMCYDSLGKEMDCTLLEPEDPDLNTY